MDDRPVVAQQIAKTTGISTHYFDVRLVDDYAVYKTGNTNADSRVEAEQTYSRTLFTRFLSDLDSTY